MKNAMQLKSLVKRYAKEKGISPQLVLQNYMHERFLERVSVSEFKTNFIIKGGLLIASLVGLDTRSTMDIDATIKGYPVTEDAISRMIFNIIKIDLKDDVTFEVKSIREIREEDDYFGYRVALIAKCQQIAVPLKVDITTGDAITPGEISYTYRLMLEDRGIEMFTYNLSSLLAEKLETIISRGDQSTRPRDYYDVYLLRRLWSTNINSCELSDALYATARKRASLEIIKQYPEIMNVVKRSVVMIERWNNYRRDFDYLAGIELLDVCDSVVQILDNLKVKEW